MTIISENNGWNHKETGTKILENCYVSLLCFLAVMDLKNLACSLFLLSYGSATRMNSKWFPLLEGDNLIPESSEVTANVPDNC